jgi:branched-chain amino acid transport system substrate-binding protein
VRLVILIKTHALAAALAVLITLAPAASLRAADPYVVEVILPVTGAGAFVSTVEINALNVAEAMFNKNGGVRGRQIKFNVQDDQSNPSVAVQLFNALIAKKTPFVLGSSLSATCNAMAELTKDGPLEYCFSPGIRPVAGSYVYSSGVDAGSFLRVGARYFRDRGLTKVAILTSTDATGQDADRAIDAAFGMPENRGLTIVAREHFNPTDINVAAQMARFRASGANVIIGWATGAPFGTILRGIRDAGIDVPVLSTPANSLAVQLRQYKTIMPKELIFPNLRSFLTPDQLPNGPAKTSLAKYYDLFRAANLHPSGEGQVWDQILIMVGALQKLGLDPKPAQVRDYVNTLRGWTGINGTYDFSKYPQRGIGDDALVVVKWDPENEVGIPLTQAGGAPLR